MATFEKLFEVSWEVCNFIGGINTVLKTKASQVIEHFKEYLMIGPWLNTNDGFIERSDLFAENIKKRLNEIGLFCKYGYWDTEGQPKVILVQYNHLNSTDILYELWKNYGIESHAAQYDYIEAVLFSRAAATVIDTMMQNVEHDHGNVFAHFHEWQTGAGLLHLKKNRPDICTVFTVHATVMGRALAAQGHSVFSLPDQYDFSTAANKFNILSRHTLEKVAAKEADAFTVVSYISADETHLVLHEYPDKITFNGLNFNSKDVVFLDDQKRIETRAILKDVASKMLRQTISDDTQIWIIAGRNEFHNKGYDVLLSSLADLESKMNEASTPIIVLFCVPLKRCDQTDRLVDNNYSENINNNYLVQLLTHRIDNDHADQILQLAKHLNFDDPKKKIHIIYCPAILNGYDGVFDIHYTTLLAACDLSIFPSFYEPWGYTPLESIACGVPTITTDLSGFSSWIKSLSVDFSDIVYVIDRRGINDSDFITKLTHVLTDVVSKEIIPNKKQQAIALSKFADWKFFYKSYLDAYEEAVDASTLRISESYLAKFSDKISSDIAKISARTSKVRALSALSCFPSELKEIVEYCHNLWWSWQLDTYQRFAYLSPSLWSKVKFNPIKLLNQLPREELKKKIKSEDFSKRFKQDLNEFEIYCKDHKKEFDTEYINDKNPIAFFCMEYGLHESLPLYAGGLGILAGDFLKTASDMDLPLIGFGLFYKYGYFNQTIDPAGYQVAKPAFIETYNEPLTLLKNNKGKEILIDVELPERICYLRIWKVNVGRITLYLLDSDTPMNNDVDRKITLNLYPAEVETRLLQGILLGIGGVRVMNNILDVYPSVFHMNECHTAFFLLERMKNLVSKGYTVSESVEIIRKTTVYTIHTPVLAGQEIYTDDIVRKYFLDEVQKIGIDMNDFIALGRTIDKNPSTFFSLTAAAIRSSYSVNAVSKLHQKVSQKIWHDLWPDALESEVPIFSVTNGIHVQTWLGSHMWKLYNKYLPNNWINNLRDKSIWENIYKIPDAEIWHAHQLQKKQLQTILKTKILTEYINRGENKKFIDKIFNHLSSNPFIIVFSRRFTHYKRPTLIFKNPERLAAILSDAKRPVILLIAGKAHPFDGIAREIIHETIQATRNEIFDARVLFLENYDIATSRFLVAGSDLWLNNPIYGMEACGTSGMKASINGVINFSVKDGWWYEAYTPEIGWEINIANEQDQDTKRDDLENYFLLNKLENEIIRTYFSFSKDGYSEDWIKKMKSAIVEVGYQFNSQRMLHDYFNLFYLPSAKRYKNLTSSDVKVIHEYVEWKNNIAKHFKFIKLKDVHIHVFNKEVENTTCPSLDVKVNLDPGKLHAQDLKVELLLMKNVQSGEETASAVIPLQFSVRSKDNILTYTLKYEIEESGLFAYAIRISPYHALLRNGTELGLVLWV